MADYTTAARPYANAVYDLASEAGDLAGWSDALSNLAGVVGDERISELLSSPEMSKQDKAKLVTDILGDKLDDKQRNLVGLMAENGRLLSMASVRDQFEIARARAENKIDAEVVSAFELTAEQTAQLATTLKNKLGCDISITTSVDPSLIGGVVIKAGDTIIDASMKSQLDSLALSLGR